MCTPRPGRTDPVGAGPARLARTAPVPTQGNPLVCRLVPGPDDGGPAQARPGGADQGASLVRAPVPGRDGSAGGPARVPLRAYTRIITISTDDHHGTQEFRASVGATVGTGDPGPWLAPTGPRARRPRCEVRRRTAASPGQVGTRSAATGDRHRSRRLVMPSFPNTFRRCHSTVRGLM